MPPNDFFLEVRLASFVQITTFLQHNIKTVRLLLPLLTSQRLQKINQLIAFP